MHITGVLNFSKPYDEGIGYERLVDGELYLLVPDHPMQYFHIARLRLSTLVGRPPAGFCRIGYRDGDVGNVGGENLFWRGDGLFGHDQPNQAPAYAQGVADASRIVEESKRQIESGIYLAGVNHELEAHLKKTTG